jgi:S1-C subfamily serine protease
LEVLPDSSACSSGIVEGSVLLNINDEPCASREMVIRAFEKMTRPIRIQFQLDLGRHFADTSQSKTDAEALNK